MPVPIVYRKSNEDAAITFDYVDIADRTGTVTFEGFESNVDTSAGASSVVETKSLSRNANYSLDTNSTGGFSGSSTSYSLFQTYNFDLTPFNAPATIKGKGRVILTFGVTRTSGSDLFQAYIKVSVVKVSNSVESTIGTYYTVPVGDNSTDSVYTVTAYPVNELDLTRTHFKIGDTLRLKLEFYGRSSGGGAVGGSLIIAHDPQNASITNFNTPSTSGKPNRLLFNCPFRLDL